MAVHPIEKRYGRQVVRQIFDEEYRLQKILDVEAALARAQAAVGDIPEAAADKIEEKANTKYVRIGRVKEFEEEINHDVMAVVKALTEQCGNAGRYVHLGATSNDITDTALALQIKKFLEFLFKDLRKLRKTLIELAEKNKHLICVGRTHGQHSVPTTYGLKFAIWAAEVQRHIDRVKECQKRILVGQMTGAVGTQAALGKNAIRIQKYVMKDLGLNSVLVSNQVIQRDRHAEFLFNLALIAETLNKIGTEIRNLQRTEIAEVSEAFERKQVGSSTMPHKRNPIYSERICGLSRVIKADAIVALENIPLWHERDLTNSSCERMIIPEACILTDYILNLSIDLFRNLVFDYKNIEDNLHLSQGRIMAESVMILLTKKGMGRQEAHELLRECSMKSSQNGVPLRDVLIKNSKIVKYVTADELDSALNPEKYVGTAVKQVDLVLQHLGYIHKM
ncbi:MAG: adenylosuccinate lyase [Candidatus Altiarchaeota archaeon]|nr:adenylosuccinate lyase [Candidatus Altiarchaeota archaeon]